MSNDPSADRLILAADRSMRRVLKATWGGTVRADAEYYCAELECGHHAHVSETMLRSPLLCMMCLAERVVALPSPQAAAEDAKAPEVHSFWLVSPKATVRVVTDAAGRITEAAPLVRKFLGQPLENLQYWMHSRMGGLLSTEESVR